MASSLHVVSQLPTAHLTEGPDCRERANKVADSTPRITPFGFLIAMRAIEHAV
jgi:hypothetical protein